MRPFSKVNSVWFSAALLLALPFAAQATDTAWPANARPLAEIVNQAQTQLPGRIVEVDRDDGVWEIKTCSSRTQCHKYEIDPLSGQTLKQRRSWGYESVHQLKRPLSQVIAQAESETGAQVVEAEFERGQWKLKLQDHQGVYKRRYQP